MPRLFRSNRSPIFPKLAPIFFCTGELGTRRARIAIGLPADYNANGEEDNRQDEEGEGQDEEGAIDRLLFDELFHYGDEKQHRGDGEKDRDELILPDLHALAS